LAEIAGDDQPDLYIIEISQQGHQNSKKSFFIKVYWRIP